MIPFNIPHVVGTELSQISKAIATKELAGDGQFTRQCEQKLEQLTHTKKALLTSSCTHALEICAFLCDIQAGDEVIMSSFTFVSAANAFVIRGAKIVFVDIHPDTMNIDERLIEQAISTKTKAIVAMHYGGLSCHMDSIMQIARQHNLIVIEDAAHCIGAFYEKQHLGTIGHLGTLSFHATKNVQCGEGGALLINDTQFIARAEMIREKGTNRKQFLNGEVNKYSWVDIGSSYLLGELSAAFLLAQLEELENINQRRILLWQNYYHLLKDLANDSYIKLPNCPPDKQHNGHIFYIKCRSHSEKNELIQFLKQQQIKTAFHYVPLHSAKAGQEYGQFVGEDKFTTSESNKLLRLPLYYDFKDTAYVVKKIIEFYTSNESKKSKPSRVESLY